MDPAPSIGALIIICGLALLLAGLVGKAKLWVVDVDIRDQRRVRLRVVTGLVGGVLLILGLVIQFNPAVIPLLRPAPPAVQAPYSATPATVPAPTTAPAPPVLRRGWTGRWTVNAPDLTLFDVGYEIRDNQQARMVRQLCRAFDAVSNAFRPGKVVNNACNIPGDGREVVFPEDRYQVLVDFGKIMPVSKNDLATENEVLTTDNDANGSPHFVCRAEHEGHEALDPKGPIIKGWHPGFVIGLSEIDDHHALTSDSQCEISFAGSTFRKANFELLVVLQ